MNRLKFWAALSRLATRVDKRLDPKPPYLHRTNRWVDFFKVLDSRTRLAVYVAWLSLRGDQTFFHRYESRHSEGVERFVSEHKREKQRQNLVAAADISGNRQLKEELGAMILKNKAQAREIRQMQESAERRNLDLAALHIVWCDGGCAGGVGSPETLDRSVVLRAVLSTKRLVSWWNNSQYRKSGHARTEDYLRERVDFEPPVVEDE